MRCWGRDTAWQDSTFRIWHPTSDSPPNILLGSCTCGSISQHLRGRWECILARVIALGRSNTAASSLCPSEVFGARWKVAPIQRVTGAQGNHSYCSIGLDCSGYLFGSQIPSVLDRLGSTISCRIAVELGSVGGVRTQVCWSEPGAGVMNILLRHHPDMLLD